MKTFFQPYTQKLEAGQRLEIDRQGELFKCIRCISEDNAYKEFRVALVSDDVPRLNPGKTGMGFRMKPGAFFKKITLENPHDVAVTITYYIATADILDSLISYDPDTPIPVQLALAESLTVFIEPDQEVIALDPATTFLGSGFTTIGDGSTIIFGATGLRRYIVIQNKDAAAELELFDSADNNLLTILPRQTIRLDGKGEIKLNNPNGAPVEFRAFSCLTV